jgi:hypothetical protein
MVAALNAHLIDDGKIDGFSRLGGRGLAVKAKEKGTVAATVPFIDL